LTLPSNIIHPDLILYNIYSADILKMPNTKRNIFFNTIFVITDTVVNKMAFFIINIIIARYLTDVKFGEYATALGFATFFAMFSDIGINTTLVRMIIKDPEHEKEHITNAFLIKTVLGIISYTALCIGVYFVYYCRNESNIFYLTLIFGVVRVGNDYMNTFYAIFSAHDKFKNSSILNSLFSILFLITTLLVVYLGGTYFHIAFSRMFVVISFIVAFLIFLTYKYHFLFTILKFKEFLSHAFFFGLGTVIQNSLYRLNIMLLPAITIPLYGGFFSNSFIFYSSLVFIPSNLGRVLISHLYKSNIEESREKYQFVYDTYTKVLTVLAFFIGLFIFVYAEEIILLIYGEKYLPSVLPLKIIAFAIPALFNISGHILKGMDKQKEITKILVNTLIANIVLNITLIFYFSMTGAAVAVIVTQYLINFQYYMYLKKNNILSFQKTGTVVIKTFIISTICFLTKTFITDSQAIYIQMPILIITFSVLVLLFVIEKRDYDIVKKIFIK